jgi:hypothetical protein
MQPRFIRILTGLTFNNISFDSQSLNDLELTDTLVCIQTQTSHNCKYKSHTKTTKFLKNASTFTIKNSDMSIKVRLFNNQNQFHASCVKKGRINTEEVVSLIAHTLPIKIDYNQIHTRKYEFWDLHDMIDISRFSKYLRLQDGKMELCSSRVCLGNTSINSHILTYRQYDDKIIKDQILVKKLSEYLGYDLIFDYPDDDCDITTDFELDIEI